MLERAVQQNAYHRQHLDYRDLPDVKPLNFLNQALLNNSGVSSLANTGLDRKNMTLDSASGVEKKGMYGTRKYGAVSTAVSNSEAVTDLSSVSLTG